ncbi:ankyrin repeat-containing domain protein [Biscogniauxia mediterranea]|nr:ankyrin repeat-containing domain protein [Biscogniauxia mediterranea]
MDPLSASASMAGLGSAVVMIGKRLKFLQSIPKARLEFCQLLNEMTALQAMLFQIDNTIALTRDPASSFPIDVPDAILVFQNKLNKAISSIDSLCDRFRSSSKGLDKEGHHRIPRARWAWEQRELPKLREQVKDCRDYLCMSFGALNISQGYKHALLAVEHHRLISESTSRIAERLDTLATRTEEGLMSIAERISTLPAHASHDSSLRGPALGAPVTSVQNTYRGSVSLDTMLYPTCPKDCACQCHMISHISSWRWLERFLGRLFISYNNSPCNSLSCRARSEWSLKLTYHIPTWVIFRAIHIDASVKSMNGLGAGLYIKIPRVIPKTAWIWFYIGCDDLTAVQRLISSRSIYPTDINADGMSLLAYSIYTRKHNITTFLLDCGSDMYFEDRYGQSPILLAWMMYLRQVYVGPQRLLHPSFSSKISGSSLIHQAIYQSDQERLKEVLLTTRVGLNDLDVFGFAPLHWATVRSDWASLRVLLDHGANHNVRNRTGATPLELLSRNRVVPRDVFDLLIGHGLDLNSRNVYGESALHHAALFSENMTAWLLESGANVDIRNLDGDTPFGFICRDSGFKPYLSDIAERNANLLLSYGADINTSIHKNHPLLWLANTSSCHNMFKSLFESGIDITVVSFHGRSVLHSLATFGQLKSYRYIRARSIRGIDPDALDNNGVSPWECLLWRQQARSGDLTPGSTKLTGLEVSEFEKLLQEIRERNWTAGLFLYSRKLVKYDTEHDENDTLSELAESEWLTSDEEFFDAMEDLET